MAAAPFKIEEVRTHSDGKEYQVSAEWSSGMGYLASVTPVVGWNTFGGIKTPTLLLSSMETKVFVKGKRDSKALRAQAEAQAETVITELLAKCAARNK